jgi:hypothetical protein
MANSSPFPDSNPIDIQILPKHSDEQMILQAMGAEAANVHLGTKRETANIFERPEQKEVELAEGLCNPHGSCRGKRLEPLQEILRGTCEYSFRFWSALSSQFSTPRSWRVLQLLYPRVRFPRAVL